MANEVSNGGQAKEAGTKRRRRGPAKLFPTCKFEDALVLPRGILHHAVGDQMRRTTLFEQLKRSPESSVSRQLVINSGRYGLTAGGMQAEYLTITPAAKTILDGTTAAQGVTEKSFSLAIEQVDVFAKLYERLKGKRLPGPEVFRDELKRLGVPEQHASQAADIFIANVRYLGLVRQVSGKEQLTPIEQLMEEMAAAGAGTLPPDGAVSQAPWDTPRPPQVEFPLKPAPSVGQPSVHIDIQIHIDSSASPQQIDQIFASMARHLYRRED